MTQIHVRGTVNDDDNTYKTFRYMQTRQNASQYSNIGELSSSAQLKQACLNNRKQQLILSAKIITACLEMHSQLHFIANLPLSLSVKEF